MPKGIPLSIFRIKGIEKMIKDGYRWQNIQQRYNVSFATYCRVKGRMKRRTNEDDSYL